MAKSRKLKLIKYLQCIKEEKIQSPTFLPLSGVATAECQGHFSPLLKCQHRVLSLNSRTNHHYHVCQVRSINISYVPRYCYLYKMFHHPHFTLNLAPKETSRRRRLYGWLGRRTACKTGVCGEAGIYKIRSVYYRVHTAM